ncbi:MAG TPA: alpha/beta fold hydrolase [Myxococcales bacterium]|nr:alpha/beta fold hydrolase [Myxococcales bacterium]
MSTRRGTGAPVVPLHGLGLGAGMWAPFAERLAAHGFEAVCVNVRGHGGSTAVDRSADLEDLAQDVRGHLADAGIERPHLVGFSMGGMIAMRLAADGLALRSLTLVSTSAQEEPLREQYEATAAYLREHALDDQSADMFTELLCSPGFLDGHPEIRRRYRELQRANDVRTGVYWASLAVIRRPNMEGRLAAIAAPTLVVCGTDDQQTPPSCARALVKAIRGAELAEIPRAGHLLVEESPELFYRAVLEHLGGRG